jgi:hypothetical protein
VFVDYVNVVRLPLIIPSGRQYPETMIFGDAIFFWRLDPSDKHLLTVQALIALLVYRKPELAGWLMRQREEPSDVSVRTQQQRALLRAKP